jgi:hypothetical protein
MFAQQGQQILQAELDNARRQDQAAAAERSRQRAEALRQQHEEQRRRQEAEYQQRIQQQHAANLAALQAQRTSNWFSMNPTRWTKQVSMVRGRDWDLPRNDEQDPEGIQ